MRLVRISKIAVLAAMALTVGCGDKESTGSEQASPRSQLAPDQQVLIPSFNIVAGSINDLTADFKLDIDALTVNSTSIIWESRLEDSLGNEISGWSPVQDTSLISLSDLTPQESYVLSVVPTIGSERFVSYTKTHPFVFSSVIADGSLPVAVEGQQGVDFGQVDPNFDYQNAFAGQVVQSGVEGNLSNQSNQFFHIGTDYQIRTPSDWHLVQSRIEEYGKLVSEYAANSSFSEFGTDATYLDVTCNGNTGTNFAGGLNTNGAEYLLQRQYANGKVIESCVKSTPTGPLGNGNVHKLDPYFANNHVAIATDGYGTLVGGAFGQVKAKRRMLINYFTDKEDAKSTLSQLNERCSRSPLNLMTQTQWATVEAHFNAFSSYPTIVRANYCELISRRSDSTPELTILVSYVANKPGSNEWIEVNWEITPEQAIDTNPLQFIGVMQLDVQNVILELPGSQGFTQPRINQPLINTGVTNPILGQQVNPVINNQTGFQRNRQTNFRNRNGRRQGGRR